MTIVNKAAVSGKPSSLDVEIIDVDVPSHEDITSGVPSNPALDDLVIVKAAAWAINPADYKFVKFVPHTLENPMSLGFDVAGEVVSIGKNVKDFKKGDTIASFLFAGGLIYKDDAPGKKNVIGSAFSNYPAVIPRVSFKIPKGVAPETAVVLPAVFGTACEAIYHIHGLPRPNLQTAAAERDSPADKRSQKKTFIVYSGGSSLGRQLIQLAAMSGYAVVTTASLKHEAELKKLGANVVIDYHGESQEVIKSIVAAVKKVGLECVGVTDTFGDDNSFSIAGSVAQYLNAETLMSAPFVSYFSMEPSKELLSKFADIKLNRCSAYYLRNSEGSELAHYGYRELLQTLVDNGQYIFSPRPKIVGHGLESIIKGMEATMAGLSGEKAVILA